MNEDQLYEAVEKLFPGGEILTDNQGQILVYTGLSFQTDEDGNLAEFDPDEQ